ncbi:MAG: prepilin-type N-terminal cleavage/methylation domain-containing protein [Elusimicrobia bacterium]|nr:prepilin-type N-terminal cleavage/methylation domain-containing protein [Elusimicrobiota bacterium]
MVSRGRRPRPGFTLVEAMMVVAIMGMIATVAPALLLQANRAFILSRVRTDLQGQARGIMYIITRELRQAQSATITIDQASGQPYYSRITFTKQQGTTMCFYQQGNRLMQKVGSNIHMLTSCLTYMAFSFPRSDNMGIISVSMTVQQTIYQGQIKALHMASQQVRVMD